MYGISFEQSLTSDRMVNVQGSYDWSSIIYDWILIIFVTIKVRSFFPELQSYILNFSNYQNKTNFSEDIDYLIGLIWIDFLPNPLDNEFSAIKFLMHPREKKNTMYYFKHKKNDLFSWKISRHTKTLG